MGENYFQNYDFFILLKVKPQLYIHKQSLPTKRYTNVSTKLTSSKRVQYAFYWKVYAGINKNEKKFIFKFQVI